MHPRQELEHGPRWIKFPAMNAEARRSGIGMMIVVPAFAGSEQRDKAEICSGVIEILLPERVIRTINHGVQENVKAGLYEESRESPERAQKHHENADADQNSHYAEAEKMAVEPAVANIRRECRQRLLVFRLAIIVIDVSQKDSPQTFENGTMGITFHIGVTVMLAMDGDPFFGVNSGPEPELHAHRERHGGMQVNATVSQSAMQINAGGKCRKLDDDNNSNNSV